MIAKDNDAECTTRVCVSEKVGLFKLLVRLASERVYN